MPLLDTEIDSTLQRAAELAGEYLSAHQDPATPVVRSLPPRELKKTLDLSLPVRGRPLADLSEDMSQVLKYSVRTGHPRFMNQLFGGVDAAGILGEWITALINTSMYTYEAAPVATLMEAELIQRMQSLVGFSSGEGVFAPGGSISNLMSVLAARHRAFPHAKQEGHRHDDRPVFFVSAAAHYSLERAAAVMGLGTEAAIKVPFDSDGRMIPDALTQAIEDAKQAGKTPFLVAATAGTTVEGAFDPIDKLATISADHDLWLHVDASLGGTVLLSKQHRSLMRGVENADSVTWNPHKMMGVPLACSATLMRTNGSLCSTNGMGADYLFHSEQEDCHDLGELSLQCGRRVDALKLWFSWQAHGDKGFEERVDHFFEMAESFSEEIESRPGFELARKPQSVSVCFRYVPKRLRHLPPEQRHEALAACTLASRERLCEQGDFLLNFATVNEWPAYRMVFVNAETTEEDTLALLDEIEQISEEL